MKRLLTTLSLATLAACSANAQVYINELLVNAPGADAGLEYFELRGTPGMSLSGYYLLGLEGQATGGKGDVNQYFDLSGFSIGANGYFIAFHKGTTYGPVIAGATAVTNAGTGASWGSGAGSTVGHFADSSGTQLENQASTLLLINRGIGAAPTLTLDLDTGNDGILDALPAGWSLLDSIGLVDGESPLATDVSYGAITFRAATGLGTASSGTLITLSGALEYVGRMGDSTGSTAGDWFGSALGGTGPNFTFLTPSDPYYTGLPISDMQFGGVNAVPEPTTIGLSTLGLLALWMGRRRTRRS
jgi:hypothetical protein